MTPAQVGDRARRLMQFLRAMQEMRTRPVRDVSEYSRVFWLSDVPAGDARCATAWTGDLEQREGAWLSLDRVDRIAPPQVPEGLEPWLDTSDVTDSSLEEPPLRESTDIPVENVARSGDRWTEYEPATLREHPRVQAIYAEWLPAWQSWATADRQDVAAWRSYNSVYALYQEQRGQSETLEIVLGMGLLSTVSGGSAVKRHIVTVGATIDLDLDTGRLSVKPDPDNAAFRLEEDMLDPQDRVPGGMAESVRESLEGLPHTFGEDGATGPSQAWTNAFSSNAVYSGEFHRDQPRGTTVAFAPALIVRRRGRESFLQAIDTVAAHLDETDEVPDVLSQLLLDPEHELADDDDQLAAAVASDGEVYFPRPANREQHEIVERLRRDRVVVVQGPPGTGKTHTIANLVTDLLAHGQRVLITSHGSRALTVLKDMLPDEVQDLCVNLADTSTRGQGDLQRSVATIIDQITKHSTSAHDKEYDRLVRALQQSRDDRAGALDGLRRIREQETLQVPAYRGRYSGTPQRIAEQLAMDEPTYGWIGRIDPASDRVSGDLILRYATLLREVTDETRSYALPVPAQSPSPTDVANQAKLRTNLQNRLERLKEAGGAVFPDVGHLDSHTTDQLQRLCDGLAHELRSISKSGYEWLDAILGEVAAGRDQLVAQQCSETVTARDAVQQNLQLVGDRHVTGLEQFDVAVHAAHLNVLADHLAGGGALRRLSRPTKPARNAEDALAVLRVDGRPCANTADVQAAAAVCSAELRLRQLEGRWNLQAGSDSQGVRAARINTVVDVLDRALALKEMFEAARSFASRIRGLHEARWHDADWVERLADHLASDHVERQLSDAEAWTRGWAAEFRTIAANTHEPAPAEAAAVALERWDVDRYASTGPLLERGWAATRAIDELANLERQMRAASPALADAIAADPAAEVWEPRARSVDEAYAWAEWDVWLRDIVDPADENRLRRELDNSDAAIKKSLLHLATNRSWRYCQSRMTPKEQQNLKLYATSTKKIGKGTGKYANQFRREARRALAKAQSAVPAWIMPLRSVVDTVPFDQPGTFDVVIVDEASQSGHEALLLLWLGKRVLVVGDDEQISPESIGLNYDAIFHQSGELLNDLPTRANFGPTHSFLDHAETLAPNPVTLLEHFRCMPEIIGFSNRLSYQNRLLPVRQFGTDRLQPVRTTYVSNGRITGRGQRAVNEREAMQIVDTIEKCCADPAYDDKSMGVVTFLGNGQARYISDALLDRLGPIEMENRSLRVDKPEAFQGDERDVIFLSLVASPEGEDGPQRIGSLTKRSDQQRINVAASRARDQVWVFHSVRPEQLSGGDMRRQYLEYLAQPGIEQVDPDLGDVQPDIQHPAFDSVFEQRAYLAITARGYRVQPQYPAGRYRIDLVVMGGAERLAVECDGDAYHDADNETDDILRQRELERQGWTFWRVRGSQFFRDPEAALEELWERLDQLGIEPQPTTTEISVHEEVAVPDPVRQVEPGRAEADVVQDPTPVATWDPFSPPTDSPDSSATQVQQQASATAPAVPEGAIAVGSASLARLREEADLIEDELLRVRDTAAAGDARVRASMSRDREKRHARFAARLEHLRTTIDQAFEIPPERLPARAWPGAVVQYRDDGTGEVLDAVMSEADLDDETYDRVGPSSPLGILLDGVQVGQRLSYVKPNGQPTVVEIIAVFD